MGVCPMSTHGTRPIKSDQTGDSLSLSIYKPTGKIRKLHLVRPDLIPYPLANEIYC
jgi:hypothetical protein